MKLHQHLRHDSTHLKIIRITEISANKKKKKKKTALQKILKLKSPMQKEPVEPHTRARGAKRITKQDHEHPPLSAYGLFYKTAHTHIHIHQKTKILDPRAVCLRAALTKLPSTSEKATTARRFSRTEKVRIREAPYIYIAYTERNTRIKIIRTLAKITM